MRGVLCKPCFIGRLACLLLELDGRAVGAWLVVAAVDLSHLGIVHMANATKKTYMKKDQRTIMQ